MENPKHTILVVDDTPGNIDLLSEILAPYYFVSVANGGEKALQIVLGNDPPDLILLDVMMPDIVGFDVCKQIKANPDRRQIPIIFVTALEEMKDEERGLEVGAADYITKPVSPAIVLARVKTHIALYDQTRHLESLVSARTEELQTTRLEIILRLGLAAEFKDHETGDHVIRMSHYARLIGEAHGMGPAAADMLFHAAPMHDVGKIGIPDRVLLKPDKLNAEEWRIMQRHAEIGAEIIGEHENELLQMARLVAITHHEKWNGSGYPNRLKGSAIPLAGRIVAIADVFDALTSVRPYKDAWLLNDSVEYIESNAGTHFDPGLMPAFKSALPQILRIKEQYAEQHLVKHSEDKLHRMSSSYFR